MTATKQATWSNRIVGYGEIVPDQALANEKNWRVHGFSQQKALSGVLRTVGLVQNVIINKRTSDEWADGDRYVETVVDGHLRISLAISEGQPTVPVTFVDLTPHEERVILVTLDPLSALAATDTDQLAALLAEVSPTDDAIKAMLADMAVKEGLGGLEVEGPDEFKAIDESLETQYCCPKCAYEWSGKPK